MAHCYTKNIECPNISCSECNIQVKKLASKILNSYQVCEYADKCELECTGKINKYRARMDCYIRRSFLIADGYKLQ